MTNNAPLPMSSLETPLDTLKYTKEMTEEKLILEIEEVFESLSITIINNKEMVPILFASEFSLEEIKAKDESLYQIKSINTIFKFFTKLIEKNKFKIEEKENLFTLTFCYEEKMEDVEIDFDIKKREIDVKEENKNIKNYINEIKNNVDDIKELSSVIIEEKKQEAIPLFTKEIPNKKLNINLIKEENCICIKVNDQSKIVIFVYVINITLEKLKELNKYFSIIDNYDRLITFFKKIFDDDKFEINKGSNDTYNLKITFNNGIDEDELNFNIPREKFNLINENKKIHNTLNLLQNEIDENNNILKSKIQKLENFNDKIFDKIKKDFSIYFLNLCWPIGSYFWTNDNRSPEELFGGKWEKIEGRFLYAADNNRRVNSTGGEERVTLTVNEIPSHNHKSIDGRKFLLSYTSAGVNSSGSKKVCDWNDSQNNDPSEYTANTGGGSSHENMPPYISAFCWRRKE